MTLAATDAGLMFSRDPSTNQTVLQAQAMSAEDCYDLCVALWCLLPPRAQVTTMNHLRAIHSGEAEPPQLASFLYNQQYATRKISFGSPPDAGEVSYLRVLPGRTSNAPTY